MMNGIEYITSLLTFYIKGTIEWNKNSVRLNTPNTVFGIIPLGSKDDTIPINQIASVGTNFKLKILYLIIGSVIFMSAISSLFGGEGSALLYIILAAIGISLVLDGFQINLNITMTSGYSQTIDFFVFDNSKADYAAQEINKLIIDRVNDTNVKVHSDRIVDAINRQHNSR